MSRLLSPAGSFQALEAAIEAGADEVYLGGGAFNARVNAHNFDDAALVKAGELCRRNKVGLCITLNTLVTDRMLSKALEFARFVQNEVRPQAFIIQDLGLASELKKQLPNAVMHASTQAQQHNSLGVEALRKIGFDRIVIAREATKADIDAIIATGIETEVFVHGALCVSQSGGCLMSSFIGKRSGNRGECAQPCRLPYACEGRYPLSLKDNCLAMHIPQLIESGVTALKIEGRMKSSDYVYTVTRIYRRLIDENRAATPDEMRTLTDAFSRNGFTDGYYTANISANMFGTHDNNEKSKYLPRKAEAFTRKINVSRETTQALPERDDKAAVSAKEQRGYVLRFAAKPERSFAALAERVSRVDVPLWMIENQPFPAGLVSAVLPRTIFEEEIETVKKLLDKARKAGIRQVTVGNIAHLPLCEGFYTHGDLSLNISNSASAKLYSDFSLSSASISCEIMPKELEFLPMALEYPVYGRLPLMHTGVCILKNLKYPCHDSGCRGILTDRTGALFPVLREFGHRNIIYNSVPLCLTDKCRELRKFGIGLYTVLVTDETASEIGAVLDCCDAKTVTKGSYTRGYWK